MDNQSRPLKLLVVVPAYEPAWALGGVVRSVSNQCRAMARAGADVSVYTTNTDGQGGCLDVPVAEPVPVGGVPVTYFPSSLGPSAGWASRQMRRRLEQTISDFDILYIAAIWQWIGISTCRMARRRHIPHVVSPHGCFLGPALRHSRLKKLVFWHSFLAGCIEAADAIRFTTEFERRGSMCFLPEKTSFVVPNPVVVGNGGLPKGRGDAGSRGRFGFARDSLVLLAVTRAHPNKRLDVVIEALALIRRAGRDARLLIAGPFDNAYGDRLKVLADRRQVSHAIVWAGYQSGAALDACYRASDLFVLPSAHENFCMAAAEAMAHGLPLVLSKHVGIAEDVEHHGAGVVTEVDVQQVADAVLSLVDADRRLEMGTRARQMATHLYGPERVSRLMLQAFRDLLSGSRSSECAWQ